MVGANPGYLAFFDLTDFFTLFRRLPALLQLRVFSFTPQSIFLSYRSPRSTRSPRRTVCMCVLTTVKFQPVFTAAELTFLLTPRETSP